MARFYVIHEDYSISRTDNEALALAAAESEIVIDTQKEVELQPDDEDGDWLIKEYTA